MESLREALASLEATRRELEIYSADESTVADLEDQFDILNVTITHEPMPETEEFLVLRDSDGSFEAAAGLQGIQTLLEPTTEPPWDRAEAEAVLSLLRGTKFVTESRGHLVAVAREIEERAWRCGEGTLLVGFQRPDPYENQRALYERLASETDLTVRIFLDEAPSVRPSGVDVVTSDADEIGQFWFVLFDGGPEPHTAGALLAEEQAPGEYHGCWTDDPGHVQAAHAYLERTYRS